MADPLVKLRECYQTCQCPTYHTYDGTKLDTLDSSCTQIAIPSVVSKEGSTTSLFIFDRSVSTRYLSKKGTSQDAYTLDSMCFVLDKRDDSYTEYLQEARRLGIGLVSLADRKDVLDLILTPSVESANVMISACKYLDSNQALPPFKASFSGPISTAIEGEKKLSPQADKRKHHSQSTADISATAASFLEQYPAFSNLKPWKEEPCWVDDFTSVPPIQVVDLEPAYKQFCGQENYKWVLDVTQEHIFKHLGKKQPSEHGRASKEHNNHKDKKMAASTSLLEEMQSSLRKEQQRTETGGKLVLTRNPIIMVPTGLSTLVTMYNAKLLLGEGKFVAERPSTKDPVIILHSPVNSDLVYELVDTPSRLSPTDWQAVVAVIVSGEEWQFKDWKVPNSMQDPVTHQPDPVRILQHDLPTAFYFYWEEEGTKEMLAKYPNTLAKWKVRAIPISRSKRHNDKRTQLEFWRAVDETVMRLTTRTKSTPFAATVPQKRSTSQHHSSRH